MHLWKVKIPFEPERFVVTGKRDVREIIDVLKSNNYNQPNNIEYVSSVLSQRQSEENANE